MEAVLLLKLMEGKMHCQVHGFKPTLQVYPNASMVLDFLSYISRSFKTTSFFGG